VIIRCWNGIFSPRIRSALGWRKHQRHSGPNTKPAPIEQRQLIMPRGEVDRMSNALLEKMHRSYLFVAYPCKHTAGKRPFNRHIQHLDSQAVVAKSKDLMSTWTISYKVITPFHSLHPLQPHQHPP
jgi:hypothetical protein